MAVAGLAPLSSKGMAIMGYLDNAPVRHLIKDYDMSTSILKRHKRTYLLDSPNLKLEGILYEHHMMWKETL